MRKTKESLHTHDYETVSRRGVALKAQSLGIKTAEMRQCRECKDIMTFVLTKDGWFPLFEEEKAEEKDILLA